MLSVWFISFFSVFCFVVFHICCAFSPNSFFPSLSITFFCQFFLYLHIFLSPFLPFLFFLDFPLSSFFAYPSLYSSDSQLFHSVGDQFIIISIALFSDCQLFRFRLMTGVIVAIALGQEHFIERFQFMDMWEIRLYLQRHILAIISNCVAEASMLPGVRKPIKKSRLTQSTPWPIGLYKKYDQYNWGLNGLHPMPHQHARIICHSFLNTTILLQLHK